MLNYQGLLTVPILFNASALTLHTALTTIVGAVSVSRDLRISEV